LLVPEKANIRARHKYLISFTEILAICMILLFSSVNRLFGKKGIKAIQLIMYQMGIDRARILQEALHIDVNDARSLGCILDFDDGLAGVKGVWTLETKRKAVKVITKCPMAHILARCPEICRTIIAAMEAGTFHRLNPNISVPEIPKLISEGSDCCVGTIELSYLDDSTGSRISPRATGNNVCPPVINIPGLKTRLACQGLKSFNAACFGLLRYGTKQDMAWYDFFKYGED
jgi:hypothetical protein